MTSFVDRVQKEIEARRDKRRQAIVEKLAEVRDSFPSTAYEIPLADTGLSTRVLNLLTEAGYANPGKVLEALGIDEDAILGLPGLGPKALEEIRETLTAFDYPVIEELVEPEAEELLEAEAVDAEDVAAAEVELEGEEVVAADTEEAVDEAVAEAEPEAAAADGVITADEIEETFEELIEKFTESAPQFVEDDETDDEAEEIKKRDKKRKTRVVEYDPELGEMVVKRRRKRDEFGEWEL
jgi:hypothetical protein